MIFVDSMGLGQIELGKWEDITKSRSGLNLITFYFIERTFGTRIFRIPYFHFLRILVTYKAFFQNINKGTKAHTPVAK